MIKQIVLFVILLSSPALSLAAIVQYVVNGQLDQYTNGYLSTNDFYGLDGASFTRVVLVDTSASPDLFAGDGTTTVWTGLTGILISNIFHITNRPNGAPDLFVEGSPYSQDVIVLTVQNAARASLGTTTYNDAVGLFGGLFSGALQGVHFSELFIHFNGNIIPGWDGYVTEPPYSFSTSDVHSVADNIWVGPVPRHGVDVGYRPIMLSASASVVPVPPAVYLFGSALGVMGWMRRKG